MQLSVPDELSEEHVEAIRKTPVEIPEYEEIEGEEDNENGVKGQYHWNETTLDQLSPETLATIFTKPEFWKLPSAMSGITCFSEHSASPLMWAHYSEQNTGFVVSYHVPKAVHKNGIFYLDDLRFAPVAYTDRYPEVTVLDFFDDKQNIQDTLTFTKGYHWSYESEWRLVSQLGGCLVDSPFEIHSVYLGYNMRLEYKKALFDVCNTLGINSYQQVPHPTQFSYLASGPITPEDLNGNYCRDLSRSLEIQASLSRLENRRNPFKRRRH
ncbi:MAG TPA: DUF2971 domain-containing protein [Pyrinomonadaceae bacterium]